MIHNLFKLLISVRAKLFFSFLMMTILVAGLGGLGVVALTQSGEVVKTTFDRPLMAINYARAAGQRFTELARDVEYTDLAVDDAEFLYSIFIEDLAVARERNLSERATEFFDTVEATSADYMAQIKAGNRSGDGLHDMSVAIASDLEIIVELQSGESFKARQAALDEVGTLRRYAGLAVLAAVLLTAFLSIWLGLTILKPLSAAAKAAKNIANGELETDIPKGRRDETGALLHAMRSMRNNIRERVERERHEKDLAQDRLSESLDNSQDAVLIANPGGRVILANAQVLALFPELGHYPLNDAVLADLFDQGGCPRFGHYQWQDERQFVSAQGQWRRINASRTREGGTLMIWTDTTHDMHTRTQLEQTTLRALAADKAKSDFLASMSHELRTPLNAVIGFADVLRKEALGPIGKKDYVDMAQHIRQSGDMLLSIFEDILEMSRGDQIQTTKSGKPTSVDDAVQRSVRNYKEKAAAKSIQLNFETSSAALFILSNPVDLERLTNKLVSNAVKFTPQGGQIDVVLGMNDANEAVLRVSDNGVGIAPEIMHTICQPFVQAEQGTKRTHDGVGLGLSVADRLVKKHGGTLNIHSEVGRGTAILVNFPACFEDGRLIGAPSPHAGTMAA